MDKTRIRILTVVVVATVAALVLAGCFGGAPKPSLAQISGTVIAPPGTETASPDVSAQQKAAPRASASGVALAGETPVAGATVIALDFATNKQIGPATTTDAQGKYTLPDLPKGIDVLVVVTKNVRGGKTIRLSTIVSDTGNHPAAAGEINAATTLSAEVWAAKIGKNVRVSPVDFQATVDASSRVLSKLTTVDLSVGGPVLAGEVGSGLAVAFEGTTEINATVPQTANSDVAPAKAMVQDIRNAGISVRDAAETQYEKQEKHLEEVVIPYFRKVSERLAQLSPNILSGMFLSYPAATYQEEADGTLTQTGPAPAADTWVIKTGALTQTVNMTFTGQVNLGSLPQGTIKVVSSEDTALDYHGELTVELDNPSAAQPNVVAARLNASMKDSVITTPLTLNAALTGTFANGYYTSVGFDGNMTSEVVTLNGKATVTLGTPDPNRSLYGPQIGAPTAIEVSGDIETAEMTASGTLKATFVEEPLPMPVKTMSFVGDYRDKGAEPTTAHGELTFEFVNVETFDQMQPESPTNPLKFNLGFKGSVTMPQRPTVTVDVAIGSQEYGVANSTLSYAHGARAISGAMSVTHEYGSNETRVVIDLTNEENLKTNFAITQTTGGAGMAGALTGEGTIVNAEKKTLATLTVEAGMLKINYADGTFETLF